MIRNLTAVGFILIAMSAVGASTASAQQGKLTSDGAVTLDLTGTVGEVWEGITTFGIRTECPETTYTGHKINTKPNALIPSGSPAFTVTPHFVSCQTGGGFHNVTITMNGCDYAFNIGETVGEDKYAVTADTVCPPGAAIEMHLYASEKESISLCTFTVKPQSGLVGLTATTNTGAGNIGIAGTFEGIHVERQGACGSSTSAEGKFHMDLTIKGTAEIGAPTDIAISD